MVRDNSVVKAWEKGIKGEEKGISVILLTKVKKKVNKIYNKKLHSGLWKDFSLEIGIVPRNK